MSLETPAGLASVTGSLHQTAFFSPTLGRTWRSTVYLPAGYETSGLRYPLLYLLHGRGGDETSWATDGRVAQVLGAATAGPDGLPPLVAVMPDGGSSWYVDGAERMETAFFSDLVPHVDALHRTLPSREGRAIAGYSMGGYGALRYALAHPELFGAAALLSPAVYAGTPPAGSSVHGLPAFGSPFSRERWEELNYPRALEGFLTRELPLPLFIAAGDAEDAQPDHDENMEVQVARLHARLRGHGCASHLRVLPGGHDWEDWAPAFAEGLRFLAGHLRRPEPSR